MSRPTLLHCVLVGTLIAGQPAHALKFVFEDHARPFHYTENGKVSGMATDVLQEMVKRAGLKPEFKAMMPGPQTQTMALVDPETCHYARTGHPQQEKALKLVGPIVSLKWGLFAHTRFPGKIESLNDARPYRVGAVVGESINHFLRQNGFTQIVEAEWNKYNPGKLTLNRKEPGKIDLWATPIVFAKPVANAVKMPIKLVLMVREDPLYLGCNPAIQPAVLKALSDALATMKQDGTYEKIVKAYEPF